jgi:hypothetical protein
VKAVNKEETRDGQTDKVEGLINLKLFAFAEAHSSLLTLTFSREKHGNQTD